MPNNPFVSIIIPVIELNDYLEEAIPQILKLNYQKFEIIVLPNQKNDKSWPKTRIIATKTSNPSVKRNIGVKNAKGKIIAFLDDDAYPKRNWLDKNLKHFQDLHVIAVGGPAVTPNSDSVLQKSSAACFESYLGGGKTRNRYLSVGKVCEVDDWPSVNLLVKREVFSKTGGFNKKFWPGEDTKLCIDLIKFGKIIYEPKAIVYHHRRASLVKHLKQIGNYGLHRGYFAKIYPKNSLKLSYIIPSIFSLYIICGTVLVIISFFIKIDIKILQLYFLPFFLYIIILIFDIILISVRYKNILVGISAIPYIFFTHIYYGLRFIKGYFSSNINVSTHSKVSQ